MKPTPPWVDHSHVVIFDHTALVVAHEFDGAYYGVDGLEDYTKCGRSGGRFVETRYADWSTLRPCRQACWEEGGT